MKMSVIVPIFNVEGYLKQCIDSILDQDIDLELILINDGSTDESGEIAKSYSLDNDNVILINQTHSGPSAARNQGLAIAKGEYIVFVDSDDWISKNSLVNLYLLAKQYNLDLIMGQIVYHLLDRKEVDLFEKMPAELKNKVFSGKECFISLMAAGMYSPMTCSFICNLKFIRRHNLKFDIGVIHEDEIWTQIVLCLSEKVLITDLDYYNYRQREGSIMNTLDTRNRLNSLFHVASRLVIFSMRYSFNSAEDNELKSWIYVNIFRIYRKAFILLQKVQDSTYKLPKHYLYSFFLIHKKMLPEARVQCYNYYHVAKTMIRRYYQWRLSIMNITIPKHIQTKIILIYNMPEWYRFSFLKNQNINKQYYITTDRRYISEASTIIFYLPNLLQEMGSNIDKPINQIWVSWNTENENNFPWINDSSFRSLFDIKIDYHCEADIVCPYYPNVSEDVMSKRLDVSEKKNNVCMVVSNFINHNQRLEYIRELMEYIDIDSYGTLYNNMNIELADSVSIFNIYSKYKFVIVFEDSVYNDFVTEKFYDPILAGSVPIYFDAPNIDKLMHDQNSFVNVRKYESPKKLAQHIIQCLYDDNEYMKYHKWRENPFSKEFEEKVKMYQSRIFGHLCNLLDEKNKKVFKKDR
jgi:glycosyltransferase involved in cell wall biosynthesis